ncbi:hypothetical protein ACFFH2_07125 [Enterococcus devriesei]|uniref:Uncharacterized protein n=1 Tax=Enterococcus devriesei TaxID=319970 RepID=A0A1L8SV57_9ENTE|nr:hypothetical protein [Enterococcus devriesei]OJG35856.1 hypothetical protein RV00_GL002000 [Enterococcus devriesei]
MSQNLLRPEVLITIVVACLITFFVTRWGMKRKKHATIAEKSEPIKAPEPTTDVLTVFEQSLAILQSYKQHLNQYGYPYFKETTPFVLQQLQAEADSLVTEQARENQKAQTLLLDNIAQLQRFMEQEVTDSKKLELEVSNHVNKIIITWRKLIKEFSNQ